MPKATKRERQRQNRDARRAAMLAEEKRRRRFKSIRLFAIIIVAAVALAFVVSLTRSDDSTSSASAVSCTDKKPAKPPTTQQFSAPPEMTIDPTATYDVTLDTSCGKIVMTLDAAGAPQSVNNFIFLAKQGFYDGTTFHRIVTDFVDQGGDPKGDGTGGPGYTLPDEPTSRAYKGGDVALARGSSGVSGSQFFLVVSDSGGKTLGGPPGQYNLLGTMSKQGLKVAQKINTFGSATEAGTPTKAIYVFSTKVSGPKAPSSTTSSSTSTTTAP